MNSPARGCWPRGESFREQPLAFFPDRNRVSPGEKILISAFHPAHSPKLHNSPSLPLFLSLPKTGYTTLSRWSPITGRKDLSLSPTT